MPQLYKSLINKLSSSVNKYPPDLDIPIDGYLAFFYLYPLVDTFLLGFYIIATNLVDITLKQFMSQIHFLLLGYRVGITLLVGYTEV